MTANSVVGHLFKQISQLYEDVVYEDQYKVALCTFSGEVTWPVCTGEDKRIGFSDIVSNQPPVSVAKHA